MLTLSLLLACPPVVSTDTAAGDTADTGADTADTGSDTGDTADTGADGWTTAVVTTTSDDYASAVLATVDLATWAVTDSITTIGTDNAVVSAGGTTWVLDRWGAAVRVYADGAWASPVQEFSTGEGTNPQTVAECGGKVWVSTYGDAQLRAYDPDSYLLTGAVDLTSLADSDGLPEAADLLVRGGDLYVALQRFDEANDWIADGGKVARIDCATSTVAESWDAIGSPSIHEWPGRAGFIVRTGIYYTPDGSALALDGGLSMFDPSNGVGSLVVTEESLGENITAVAMVDDHHGLFLTQDADSVYTAWCWDLNTTERVELFSTTSFLQGVDAGPDGEAWIVARQSWTDPTSQGGIITVDAVACVPGSETWHTGFTFSPYAVAFY